MSYRYTDTFSRYEIALDRLLNTLGVNHPLESNGRVLQQRLMENIASARSFGDTPTQQAGRAQILASVNILTQQTQDMSFHDWAENCLQMASFGNLLDDEKERHAIPSNLQKILRTRFNMQELVALCHDLGISYEQLPHRTLMELAINLSEYLRRRHQSQKLLDWIKNNREDIDLSEYMS